ncbi:MAG: hypothetical protein OXU77_08530 [Gammaproteobacteria bacterium]|nr:hypothetical protein [Gammaproteobacteria bacterium]
MTRTTYIAIAALGLICLLAFLVAHQRTGPEGAAAQDPPAPTSRDAQPPASRSVETRQVHMRLDEDGEVGNSDCLNLVGDTASNSRSMLDRQGSVLQAFFKTLDQQGLDLLQRQLVADRAGLDPFSVEPGLRSPRESSYASYLLPAPRPLDVSLSVYRRLDEALKRPTLDQWILEVVNEPSILGKRWRPTILNNLNDATLELWHTSVLGHVLRRRGVELGDNLDRLPSGSFGLHELAVAIETGLSSVRFLEALDRSHADPRATWSHHRLYRDVNLAVVAAFSGRDRILRALMDRGVEPSGAGHSVLDELAIAPGVDHRAMEHIVRELVSVGDQPYFPSSIDKFKLRYPDLPGLVLHPNAVMALATPGIDDSVERMTSIAAEWGRKVAEARRLEALCGETWLAAADVATESLVGKMRHQRELDRRFDQVIGEASQKAQSFTDRADPQFLNAIDLMREALVLEDWSEVLRLADEAALTTFPEGADREDFYLTLLNAALRWGAPTDAVRTLVDRYGGSLPPDTILWLVGGDAVGPAMALELEKLYGIDVHFVDQHGRNAVSTAVQRFRESTAQGGAVVDERTMRWLNYLIDHSVSPKPSPFGLDPLDTVLLAILESPSATPAGVGLARFLIDNGAPIETSHRQLVRQIQTADVDRFELLVAVIPALIPS